MVNINILKAHEQEAHAILYRSKEAPERPITQEHRTSPKLNRKILWKIGKTSNNYFQIVISRMKKKLETVSILLIRVMDTTCVIIYLLYYYFGQHVSTGTRHYYYVTTMDPLQSTLS